MARAMNLWACETLSKRIFNGVNPIPVWALYEKSAADRVGQLR